MKKIIFLTIFFVNIVKPAAQEEQKAQQETPFFGLIKQHLKEGGLSKDILEFLNKNDWILEHQIQTNADNPIIKVLVLKNGTMILAYKNGNIEIREKNHESKHININVHHPIRTLEEASNNEFKVFFDNGAIYEVEQDMTTKNWNANRSPHTAIGFSALQPQPILIDNLQLNTNTLFAPKTGFTVDNNGLAKIYVFRNQKKMLELMH